MRPFRYKIACIVKNHQEGAIGFGDFKDKAVDRDMEPEFETSNSLAICGFLVPGRLQSNPADGSHRFLFTTATLAKGDSALEVALDEVPNTALLTRIKCYLLPLVASKCDEQGTIYVGKGLVVIASVNFRQSSVAKLEKHKPELELLLSLEPPGSQSAKTPGTELFRLRICVEALQTWLDKIATREVEFGPSKGLFYRRISAVHFDDMTAETWTSIRMNEKKKFWLD